MAKDPMTIAKKWSDNLSNAANNGTIAAGIDSVTVAPGQAAARQKDTWAANVAQAKDRWATNVAAVSLPAWQDAAKTKGVARVATGAAAAENKMASFMGKLMPAINNAKGQLPARGSFQQNLTRANQMATQLHALKGQFK